MSLLSVAIEFPEGGKKTILSGMVPIVLDYRNFSDGLEHPEGRNPP